MRIISGKYRNTILKGFQINGTRPTMDRVKESMFAMIQDKIKDSTILDLFAGSGSLGLECLSNYAQKVYFIDNNKIAINTINENIHKVKCQEAEVWKMDYMKALQQCKANNLTFDLIFLDPPYALHLINSCLYYIEKNNLLKEDGMIICEHETEVLHTTLKLWKSRNYGQTKISIYQNSPSKNN